MDFFAIFLRLEKMSQLLNMMDFYVYETIALILRPQHYVELLKLRWKNESNRLKNKDFRAIFLLME